MLVVIVIYFYDNRLLELLEKVVKKGEGSKLVILLVKQKIFGEDLVIFIVSKGLKDLS